MDYPKKAFIYPPGAVLITFVKDVCALLGLKVVDPVFYHIGLGKARKFTSINSICVHLKDDGYEPRASGLKGASITTKSMCASPPITIDSNRQSYKVSLTLCGAVRIAGG